MLVLVDDFVRGRLAWSLIRQDQKLFAQKENLLVLDCRTGLFDGRISRQLPLKKHFLTCQPVHVTLNLVTNASPLFGDTVQVPFCGGAFISN